MDGKKVKRLDKSIQSLMDMLRDFAHKRLMKIRKGYRGYKLFDIDKSHKKSEEIDCPLVEGADERGKVWCIQSTTTGMDIYEIREGDAACECQLRCKECDLCLHNMTCSCPNYFSGNLCKHIHYWKRMQPQTSEPTLDDSSERNPLTIIDSSERDEDIRDTVNDINLITSTSSLVAEKKDLADFITATIHSLQSSEEVQNFREKLENIMGSSHSNSQEFIESDQLSLKRKIEKQKRFCTTKKTRSSTIKGGARRSQSMNIATSSNLVTTQIERID